MLRSGLVAIVFLGGFVSSNFAQANDVETAVKNGGAYLQKAWANGNGGNNHKVGGAALAGMAMLEAGIKKDDPAIQKITKQVRDEALSQTETYQVSLCIMFLDKLGEAQDIPVIQMLGVRLYAGMTSAGKWTYSTWEAVPADEVRRLQTVLSQADLKSAPGQKPPAPQPQQPQQPLDPFTNPGGSGGQKPQEPAQPDVPSKVHPEVARIFVIVVQTLKARGRGAGGGDNSNTQFGMIGLWVASRHGLPVKDAFLGVEAAFLKGQNPKDGGWGYTDHNGGGGNSTTAMTCAGLIGLALGAGVREVRQLNSEPKPNPSVPGGKEEDPFFNPKKKDGSPAEPTVPTPKNEGGIPRSRPMEVGLVTIGLEQPRWPGQHLLHALVRGTHGGGLRPGHHRRARLVRLGVQLLAPRSSERWFLARRRWWPRIR
jgi:hypothetical protein